MTSSPLAERLRSTPGQQRAGGNPRTTYIQRDMLGSIGVMTDKRHRDRQNYGDVF